MRRIWVLALWGCLSCTREPQPIRVAPDASPLRYAGRIDRSERRAPRLSWAGTEIHVRFVGSSVTLLASDLPFEDTIRETDWVNLEIDGKARPPLALREGNARYVLAQGLPAGTHDLVLQKRTEPEVGTIVFHGFELSPGAKLLATSPAPRRRIEVVGDSISAGYGNEGKSAECHWSASTEDASRSYAAVAARELGAELTLAAWSGKGVTRNYDARDTVSLIDVFDRAVPTDPRSARLPKAPVADVLVLNIGTNDFLAGKPEPQVFVPALRRWIERMRERAPKAPLFLVLGPMLADDYPHPGSRSELRRFFEALIAERAKQGDQLSLVEQYTDPAEVLGCDFHPSLATHARLGRELAQVIEQRMGW